MAIIEFGTEELDAILEADAQAPVADLVVEQSAVTDGRRVLAGLDERLSGWWAAGLAVAWFAIFTTGVALEPSPADPNAALPLVETLLVSGLMIGWFVMAAGFARRRRYGAAGAPVAARLLAGITLALPPRRP